jgi:hypothetical protein
VGIDKRHLKIDLCLDPKAAHAGEYVGAVELAGPGIDPVQIPMVVTIQDRASVGLAVFLTVMAIVSGAFYRWAVNRPEGKLAKDLKEFGRYVISHYLNAGVAFVAGFGAAYAIYAKNLTFGAKPLEDQVTLLTAVFAAVVTVMTPAKPGVTPES